jgi:hypothetical protein
MNTHLYEKALQAATELFSDQSVGPRKTISNLRDLIGEINTFIDCLNADLDNDDDEDDDLEEEDEDEGMRYNDDD